MTVDPARSPAARLVALVVVLALAASACGSGQASGAASGGPSSGADGASSPASASVPPGEFTNPVLQADFPDPFVLRDGGSYYAYATTNGAQNLQAARSDDLVHWETLPDPLPKLPEWSPKDTWAPEVAKTSAGYVMYYTTRDADLKRPDGNGSQCISTALSSTPEGPFVDDGAKPFVCQADMGGSIDSTEFRDADGSRYLIWKNDGNCCGLPTRFWIQPLSADGRKLTGEAHDLGVRNDEAWEGNVIEAPTLLREGDAYYLFYSANAYDSEFYAVGYATSRNVMGPYHDAAENPILATAWGHEPHSRARGPGHQSIVRDDAGTLWLVYHAWDEAAVGYANGGMRSMWIDELRFENGKPVVDGPDDGPEPAPAG